MIKKHADYVTREERGAGVAELAGMIMATDLKELEPQLKRHEIPLRTDVEPGRGIHFPVRRQHTAGRDIGRGKVHVCYRPS